MKILFDKYHGTGNDFVIADNRNNQYDGITTEQVRFICNRHFGVGADGFILLENAEQPIHFYMKYYNADGNLSSMCGNGGRCTIAYAASKKILSEAYTFTAADGLHHAVLLPSGEVHLQMQDVENIERFQNYSVLNTGSPHYVAAINNLQEIDMKVEGRKIRNNDLFIREGINVNFVEENADDSLFVRTYERGVEDETESCGTGVTACALVYALEQDGAQNRHIITPGGNLQVSFKKLGNKYSDILLKGPARFVFTGEIDV